jgi:hypothetical protein
VRIRIRKLCKALEEDAFRPVLHHYDGPKFRLELSIAEVYALTWLLVLNLVFSHAITAPTYKGTVEALGSLGLIILVYALSCFGWL